MKTYNHINNNRAGRVWKGLIILVIGLIFLVRNFGISIPHWLLSWHMLLIVIGIATGIKRQFRGGGWLIMILIGGYFTMADIVDWNFSSYYFPVAFILLGLFIIFKPSRKDRGQWGEKYADFDTSSAAETEDFGSAETKDADSTSYIDSVNVFSGSKQRIYSKVFKGGEIVSVFGGCELDLTQADFEGIVVLDVVAIFGGLKLTIPPTWVVKSEVTPVFGGIDDRRGVLVESDDPQRIIKIKGVALFGGLTITNF